MTVRLWNASEERHELVLNGHTDTIRAVAITSDGKYVVSAGADLTVRLWNINAVSNMEVADIGNSIDTFLYLTKIKTDAHPTEQTCQTIFGSLKINLAHFYSYLGKEELLSEALKLGTEIRIDDDGRSPLYYALIRNSQSCIDTILRYLIELKSVDIEKFLNYTYALRGDFLILFNNSSINLPEFLDALFYKIPKMPNFGVPNSALPMLHYSSSEEVCLDHFVCDINNIKEGQTEIPIEFKTLPFMIPYIPGSAESIELLENISNCPNQQILKSEFVRTYIRNKWENIWLSILLVTILLWSNIILMVTLIILGSSHNNHLSFDYLPVAIAFVAINGILLIYESFQAFTSGVAYFFDFWNIIDNLRMVCCFTWVCLIFYYSPNDIHFITWTMSIFNFFRCLSGFRAFDATRYYTKLIFRAFDDAISFVLIFFYSTFAFGVILYASNTHDNVATAENDIFGLWRSPYALNMGGFDDADITQTPLTYIYFMMASVINVIIMLNLLISILGDSFDSFQNECVEIDNLEMASFIIEIETLMYWNKHKPEKRYIQKCDNVHVEGEGAWEGKIKAIHNSIERSRKETNKQLAEINGKLDQLLKK